MPTCPRKAVASLCWICTAFFEHQGCPLDAGIRFLIQNLSQRGPPLSLPPFLSSQVGEQWRNLSLCQLKTAESQPECAWQDLYFKGLILFQICLRTAYSMEATGITPPDLALNSGPEVGLTDPQLPQVDRRMVDWLDWLPIPEYTPSLRPT